MSAVSWQNTEERQSSHLLCLPPVLSLNEKTEAPSEAAVGFTWSYIFIPALRVWRARPDCPPSHMSGTESRAAESGSCCLSYEASALLRTHLAAWSMMDTFTIFRRRQGSLYLWHTFDIFSWWTEKAVWEGGGANNKSVYPLCLHVAVTERDLNRSVTK